MNQLRVTFEIEQNGMIGVVKQFTTNLDPQPMYYGMVDAPEFQLMQDLCSSEAEAKKWVANLIGTPKSFLILKYHTRQTP